MAGEYRVRLTAAGEEVLRQSQGISRRLQIRCTNPQCAWSGQWLRTPQTANGRHYCFGCRRPCEVRHA